MADKVYELFVEPSDVVRVSVAPAYHGPFAGDASARIHVLVNDVEVLRVSGSFKDVILPSAAAPPQENAGT
jgi:hypothetical protein